MTVEYQLATKVKRSGMTILPRKSGTLVAPCLRFLGLVSLVPSLRDHNHPELSFGDEGSICNCEALLNFSDRFKTSPSLTVRLTGQIWQYVPAGAGSNGDCPCTE